jgi:hypothetical protein
LLKLLFFGKALATSWANQVLRLNFAIEANVFTTVWAHSLHILTIVALVIAAAVTIIIVAAAITVIVTIAVTIAIAIIVIEVFLYLA